MKMKRALTFLLALLLTLCMGMETAFASADAEALLQEQNIGEGTDLTPTPEITEEEPTPEPETPAEPTPGPETPAEPTPGSETPVEPSPEPETPAEPTPEPETPAEPTPEPETPVEPSPTAEQPVVPSPTANPSETPKPSATPGSSATPKPSATPGPSATPKPSAMASPLPSLSPTPSPSPTPEAREAKPLLGEPKFNALVTSPNDAKVARGGSCLIQVRLPEGITNCGGFTVDITYDNTRVNVAHANSPLNTGSNVVILNKTAAANKVRMVYVSGSIGSPAVLYGEVFSVSFTIPGNAALGEAKFNVSVAEICDAYGQPIPGIGTGSTATVAVAPPQPVLLTPVVTDHSYVTVKWTPVDTSIVKYNIYRRTGSGGWSLLDTAGAGKSAFADRTIRVNTSYYYTVQPFITINGARLYGPYDTTGKLATIAPPDIPVLKRTWVVNNRSIGVSWNAASGAGAYVVYRKPISGGGLSRLGETNSTSFVDTAATQGVSYSYTVQAYNYDGNGQKAYGGYDQNGIAGMIPYLHAPNVTTSIPSNYASVGVAWNAVTGAKGYAVYRKRPADANWTTLAASTTSTSFTDTTALRGFVHYYTVRPYTIGSDGSKIWGAYNTTGTQAVYAEPGITPLVSVSTNGVNSVTVNWQAAERAPYGYYVLRKVGANGAWKSMGSVRGYTFTDTTARPGTTYYYTVQAYCLCNGSTVVYGPYANGLRINTPVLDAPVLVSATPVARKSITVSWNSVPGAGDYVLLRKLSGGDWSAIATVSGTSRTDNSAAPGTQYYYSVQAIARDGSGNLSYGNYDTTGLPAMIPYTAAPTVQATAASDFASVRVSWNAVSDARGYAVYRRTDGSSTWETLISGVSGTTYSDTTAVRGVVYYYTVEGYTKLDNGANVWGAYNTTGVRCMISAPGITPLTSVYVNNANSITVRWNAASGAPSGYYVLRKVGTSGSWKSLGTVSGYSFTDNSARPGTTYIYTVQAYCESHGVNVYGAYNTSGLQARTPAPGTPSLISATPIARKSITVRWNSVPYAGAYMLLRKVSGGSWKLIANASGTSYTDTSAKPGTQYYYTVQSVARDGLGNLTYGGYNATGIVAIIPYTAAPTVSVRAQTASSVRISWNAVSNARGYAVYRRVDGSNTWETVIAGISGTTFVDTTLSRGVAYYYTVEGYTTLPNGTNIWGDYDRTGKIIGLP